MLELAFLNQSALNEKWKECLKNDMFFYYFFQPYNLFQLEIVNNDSGVIQYVSKNNNGELLGFYAAYINRAHYIIENVDIINLTGKPNFIFSNDLLMFIDILLIKRAFRKIIFHAIADNPAINIYDRFLKKYLIGKRVGILKNNKLLTDGKYHDEIIYEIYRNNFVKYKNKIRKR
jgi:hypothetical protein